MRNEFIMKSKYKPKIFFEAYTVAKTRPSKTIMRFCNEWGNYKNK